MTVMRAKVRVESVCKTEYGETLKMHAVCGGKFDNEGRDENNTFARFTPSADFQLQVNNPDLHGKFAPGQEYYVDFTLAETPK